MSATTLPAPTAVLERTTLREIPRGSDAGRMVVGLFGSAAGFAALVRLIEYELVSHPAPLHIGRAVGEGLPLPALGVLLMAGVYVACRRRWVHRHPMLPGLAAVVAGVLGLVVLNLASPWGLGGWLSAEAFAFVRWDVVFVGGVGVVAFALMTRAPARMAPAARGGTRLLAGALTFFYMCELAAMTGFGIPGSYYPVRDFFSRTAELLPLMKTEVQRGAWVLLTLPVVVALLPVGRRKAAPPEGRSAGLWPILPLMAVLILTPAASDGLPSESAIGRLFHTVREDLAEDDGPVLEPPPFDATALRLVPTARAVRRNVVVVVLESVRASATTPYAPALPTTPFLAGLAARGALVERMYAEVPYTNKALVSLFAGIPPSPEPNLVEAEAVPGGLPARGLPSLLGEHGYRTAFFTPATLEFERKDVILENLGFAEAYGDGDFPTAGFAEIGYFGYEDRSVLGRTLDWMAQAQAAGDPFFVGLLTLTSHHPYEVPPSFPRAALGPEEGGLNDYLNAIRYTDDFLRAFVEGMEARGLLEETVLVVVGDHGEAFGEHGARTHDTIWDEVLRVPAVVVAPGRVAPGSRIEGPRTSGDLVPTVADLLGFRLEGGRLPGQSLLQPVASDRRLYHSTKNGRVAQVLTTGRWKFVYWGRHRPMQVFDLADDPGEVHDLAPRLDPALLRAVEAELVMRRSGVAVAYHRARARLAGASDLTAQP